MDRVANTIALRGNEDDAGAKGAAAKFPAFTRLTFDPSPRGALLLTFLDPCYRSRIPILRLCFGEASLSMDFFFFFVLFSRLGSLGWSEALVGGVLVRNYSSN